MKITVKKKIEFEAKHLFCKIGVRYSEDASINGKEDTEGNLMPFLEHGNWNIKIDIETGQIIGWPRGTIADVHYKVCDNGNYILFDEENKEVIKYRGYVPKCLQIEENGYGDYVIIKIDSNGYIHNWEFSQEDINHLNNALHNQTNIYDN